MISGQEPFSDELFQTITRFWFHYLDEGETAKETSLEREIKMCYQNIMGLIMNFLLNAPSTQRNSRTT